MPKGAGIERASEWHEAVKAAPWREVIREEAVDWNKSYKDAGFSMKCTVLPMRQPLPY